MSPDPTPAAAPTGDEHGGTGAVPPPGLLPVLGDEPLVTVDVVDGVRRLRAGAHRRDVLVLHAPPPDSSPLVDEADVLARLDAGGPVPGILASGRGDAGDEWLALRSTADAVAATCPDHGLDPAELVGLLAGALRQVHALDPAPLDGVGHLDRSLQAVHERAAARVAAGLVGPMTTGPFAGRLAEELLAASEAEARRPGARVVVHGRPVLAHLWVGRDLAPALTGWGAGGLGDPHLDLAVAAVDVARRLGPALVAPFVDAYGTDRVDPRRLDACQMMVHLCGDPV